MIRGTKRPRVKAVEIVEPKTQKIDAKLNASIHNRFDIEVVDVRTGEIKQRAQAENIICNQLWTRLLTPTTYFNYIHYGTGNGTPSVSDTSLFTFLGYGAPLISNDIYTHDPSGVFSIRRKIVLLETVAVGSILTEVGIAHNSTSTTLCTHAMIKDMNGNQISISKTSTDIITIYATVFVHYPAFSEASSIYVTPIPDQNGIFTATIDGYSSWLLGVGAPTINGCIYSSGSLSGSSSYETGTTIRQPVASVYNIANKTLTINATRLAAASGNGDGFLAVRLSGLGFVRLLAGGSWYIGTTITAEAIGTGDGTTKEFATDFSVITNPTIYVDGVPVSSGVNIDLNTPNRVTTMGVYFWAVSIQASTQLTLEATAYGDNSTGYQTYYNPFYSLGIDSFQWSGGTWVSNDLEEWINLGTGPNISVPSAYKQYKYWKFYWNNQSSAPKYFVTTGATSNNIHFDTPPAAGAVITADYTTKTIAKDANHVFDLTVTIQFGEYTE